MKNKSTRLQKTQLQLIDLTMPLNSTTPAYPGDSKIEIKQIDFKEKIVLFYTGQSEKSYENYYEGAKFISEEVAHELVRRKVKAIGIDAFSPDTEPYPIHKILLPANILIIENLVNLKALLGKRFTVHYFPLKISGGDGAPCRAVAFVE